MDNRIMENAMCENGVEYISDTEKHSVTGTELFVGLIVTSDATILQIELVPPSTGNTMAGAVIPQGVYPLRFRSITLTSGTVIAPKGA